MIIQTRRFVPTIFSTALLAIALFLSPPATAQQTVLIDFENFEVGAGIDEVNSFTSSFGLTFDVGPLSQTDVQFQVVTDPNNPINKIIRSGTAPPEQDILLNFSVPVDLVGVRFPDNPEGVIPVGLCASNRSGSAENSPCNISQVDAVDAIAPTFLVVGAQIIRAVGIESVSGTVLIDNIQFRFAGDESIVEVFELGSALPKIPASITVTKEQCFLDDPCVTTSDTYSGESGIAFREVPMRFTVCKKNGNWVPTTGGKTVTLGTGTASGFYELSASGTLIASENYNYAFSYATGTLSIRKTEKGLTNFSRNLNWGGLAEYSAGEFWTSNATRLDTEEQHSRSNGNWRKIGSGFITTALVPSKRIVTDRVPLDCSGVFVDPLKLDFGRIPSGNVGNRLISVSVDSMASCRTLNVSITNRSEFFSLTQPQITVCPGAPQQIDVRYQDTEDVLRWPDLAVPDGALTISAVDTDQSVVVMLSARSGLSLANKEVAKRVADNLSLVSLSTALLGGFFSDGATQIALYLVATSDAALAGNLPPGEPGTIAALAVSAVTTFIIELGLAAIIGGPVALAVVGLVAAMLSLGATAFANDPPDFNYYELVQPTFQPVEELFLGQSGEFANLSTDIYNFGLLAVDAGEVVLHTFEKLEGARIDQANGIDTSDAQARQVHHLAQYAQLKQEYLAALSTKVAELSDTLVAEGTEESGFELQDLAAIQGAAAGGVPIEIREFILSNLNVSGSALDAALEQIVNVELFDFLSASPLETLNNIEEVILEVSEIAESYVENAGVTMIEIDLRRNRINPRSNGAIPVTIFTTADFDATQINVDSLMFGPEGAKSRKIRFKDVDKDGDIDVVARFQTEQTGIACGDASGVLSGQTSNGEVFSGSDSISTVGCNDDEGEGDDDDEND